MPRLAQTEAARNIRAEGANVRSGIVRASPQRCIINAAQHRSGRTGDPCSHRGRALVFGAEAMCAALGPHPPFPEDAAGYIQVGGGGHIARLWQTSHRPCRHYKIRVRKAARVPSQGATTTGPPACAAKITKISSEQAKCLPPLKFNEAS